MNFQRYLAAVRQRIVLTPPEKQAVCCVIAALIIGISTKHYRATHPRPAPAAAATKKQKRPFVRVTPAPADEIAVDTEPEE